MDHSRAVEHHVVEQYLLEELSPELRDEFEEHFFDCQECAADLRATSAFLQAAREELSKDRFADTQTSSPLQFPSSPRKSIHWRPSFALYALAASLLVMVYQNTVTLPAFRSEVASLEKPEILPSVSLVGGDSRGGSLPSVSTSGAHSLLVQIDIPAQSHFASYTCSLYSAQHQLVWMVPVSAAEATDTVSIRVPLSRNAGGIYSLEVRGLQSGEGTSSASGTELARYRFAWNASASGEGH